MIIHDVEQGSPEWHKLRLGKLTGYDFYYLMGDSETRNKIILQKASEIIAKSLEETTAKFSQDIIRGRELEDEAVLTYEMTRGIITKKIGFVESDNNTGCSPDRLVGDDGLLEIKCPNRVGYLSHYLNKPKKEYFVQMQYDMMITERKWCDYVAYNRAFELFVERYNADYDLQAEMKKAIIRANIDINKVVKEYYNKINFKGE